MWCKTEQSVPAKLIAIHECNSCSNVLHRLKIQFCCSKAQQCKNTFQIVTMHVTQTGHCRLSHASTVYFNSVWDPLGMHELWHTDKALQDFTCRQILQKTLASFAVWRTILECILLGWETILECILLVWGASLECMSLTATWNWSENAPETDQILRLQLFTGDVLGISLTLLQYIGLLDRCAVSRHDEQLAFWGKCSTWWSQFRNA